jgi:hypothetical protein
MITQVVQLKFTESTLPFQRILLEELKTLPNFKFVTTPAPDAVCLYIKLSTGPRFDDDTFTLDEQNEINSRKLKVAILEKRLCTPKVERS